MSKKAYVINWSDTERGSETAADPYTNLPCAVPTAGYDVATATLYEVEENGDWDEIDSETIELRSPEEAVSEDVWRHCEQSLAERNGVGEYDVETPW